MEEKRNMIIEVNGVDEYVSSIDDALDAISKISPELVDWIDDYMDSRKEEVESWKDKYYDKVEDFESQFGSIRCDLDDLLDRKDIPGDIREEIEKIRDWHCQYDD